MNGTSTKEEIVALTIFDTNISEARLRSLVKSLEHPPGYGQGTAITEDDEIPGAYIIERHRGEISDDVGRVRVVQNQIWAGKYAYMIDNALRHHRVSYTEGDVKVPTKEACASDARKIDVSRLEGICKVSFS